MKNIMSTQLQMGYSVGGASHHVLLNSDTGLENWQQILHEVSTRRCARIDRAVRWVGTEIREPPSFHGINDLEEFLTKYEDEVLENQRLLSLYIALKETPARWWGAQRNN
jgi:hypothetical protein